MSGSISEYASSAKGDVLGDAAQLRRHLKTFGSTPCLRLEIMLGHRVRDQINQCRWPRPGSTGALTGGQEYFDCYVMLARLMVNLIRSVKASQEPATPGFGAA
jgi:hypothetical protein